MSESRDKQESGRQLLERLEAPWQTRDELLDHLLDTMRQVVAEVYGTRAEPPEQESPAQRKRGSST